MGPDLHSRLAAELCAAIPHGRRAACREDICPITTCEFGSGAHDDQSLPVPHELHGGRGLDSISRAENADIPVETTI